MPENKIAKALRIIGYVIIGGGIIGSFILGEKLGTTETYGYHYTYSEVVFNWTVTLTGIFSSVVSGSLFIGFSEVIKILHNMSLHMKELEAIFFLTEDKNS